MTIIEDYLGWRQFGYLRLGDQVVEVRLDLVFRLGLLIALLHQRPALEDQFQGHIVVLLELGLADRGTHCYFCWFPTEQQNYIDASQLWNVGDARGKLSAEAFIDAIELWTFGRAR